MRRRIAAVGDILSTGGHVADYPADMNVTFYGHQPALIGGDAYCKICNCTGKIVKAGGPSRRLLKDREIALDGDQVLCNCAVPPQIVALLARSTWHEDGADQVQESAADLVSDEAAINNFSERFTLKDSQGVPLAGAFYTLKTASGLLIRGVTDEAGRTQRYKSDGEQVVSVFLGHREQP
jgi:hypothetical protein